MTGSRRILTLYPNCSYGGMATVYCNRARFDSETLYDFIFYNDYQGGAMYECLPNVDWRIIRKKDLETVLPHLLSRGGYDEVRLTSLPEMAALIEPAAGQRLVYEFHSSSEPVIEGELARLDLARLDEIYVPSRFMADLLHALLPADSRHLVRVLPNLVDTRVFNARAQPMRVEGLHGLTPLIWVGRNDKGKNLRDFLRIMSLLPPVFAGIVVLGLEKEPVRMAEAVSEAAQYGLGDRVRFLLNRSQAEMAALYACAASQDGYFCSTSLGESFGYGVAEAGLCGLTSVVYNVGALPEHAETGLPVELVDVGDLHGFAARLRALHEATQAARSLKF